MSNTEKNMEIPKAPDPYFRLSNELELKMSYGFLNRIAKVVGNVENVGLILVDLNVQEAVLITALSEYDAKGKLVKQADPEEVMLLPEEILSLLAWITEHLTHFFLKNLLAGEKVVGQFQKMAALNLGLLTTGSPS